MIDERKLIEFINSDDFSKTIIQSKDSLQNILIQLIEEQSKIENTENFKHFKLYSDSTLKSMSRDDLIDYIYMIYQNLSLTDISYNNMMNYADALQNDIEQLEKALDKACEELENLSYVKGLGQVGKNFKEWKVWCLKDVD